jgi:hypothetical protein
MMIKRGKGAVRGTDSPGQELVTAASRFCYICRTAHIAHSIIDHDGEHVIWSLVARHSIPLIFGFEVGVR